MASVLTSAKSSQTPRKERGPKTGGKRSKKKRRDGSKAHRTITGMNPLAVPAVVGGESWILLRYDLGTAPCIPEEQELWSPDVLGEIFLYLPLDRRTLLAVSRVSQAWEFYSNYLPQWGVLFAGLEGRTREEVAAAHFSALAKQNLLQGRYVTPLCDCFAHWPTAFEVLFCCPCHCCFSVAQGRLHSMRRGVRFNWLEEKYADEHGVEEAQSENYCNGAECGDMMFAFCFTGLNFLPECCEAWHGARPTAPWYHTVCCLPLRMCQVYRQHNLEGKTHFMVCVRSKYQVPLDLLRTVPPKRRQRMG